jgi:excisionase family DNA binding protein
MQDSGGTARPLISPTEAAAVLGMSRSAVHGWLRRGVLPGAFRIGSRWYLKRRELEVWLAGNGNAGNSPTAEAGPVQPE